MKKNLARSPLVRIVAFIFWHNSVLNRRVSELVQTQGGITRTKTARVGGDHRRRGSVAKLATGNAVGKTFLIPDGVQVNGSTSGQWVAGIRAVFGWELVRS